jgi:hypothetical protein
MTEYLDLTQWALLFGALMPLVVGIVTKKVANASVKATTLLVLNAINGIFTDWFATPNGFDWKGAIVNALAGLITSVGMYYGFLKHNENLGLNVVTANFGMGGGSHPRAEDPYHRAA